MHERFFGLLLFTVQAQQAVPGLRSALAQRVDAHLGFVYLRGAGLGTHCQTVYLPRQRARFRAQRNHRFSLRGATRFPLCCLSCGLRDFRGDLPPASG